MDEEDSDGMGLYSPSKNGTEFTPSIKKIKRSHVTHIPDMQSNQLISAKTDSIGVIGLSLKDAQKHEKATGNLNMAALDNDKDSDSQATSPASQQPSEATFLIQKRIKTTKTKTIRNLIIPNLAHHLSNSIPLATFIKNI